MSLTQQELRVLGFSTTAIKSLQSRDAQKRRAQFAAEKRAHERRAAIGTGDCIHGMSRAFCAVCLGQDPHEWVENPAQADQWVYVPTPENVPQSTKWDGRGYESRTQHRLRYDGASWLLARHRTMVAASPITRPLGTAAVTRP
jgi:hypothetical protein